MGDHPIRHVETYRGLDIKITEVPSDIWETGFCTEIFDADGVERLADDVQNKPQDFQSRTLSDAIALARMACDTYHERGQRWHVPDEELRQTLEKEKWAWGKVTRRYQPM